MSEFLRLATETADVIEFGAVQDGSEDIRNYSDFDRLLGLKEARRQQQRKIDEKRELRLLEIEQGRRARQELREQIQQARNEKIAEELRQKKRAEQEAKQQAETSLRDQFREAMMRQQQQQAGASSAGNAQGSGSGSSNSSDPFLRFRAEDSRVRADRERVAAMRRAHGAGGCDLLRRFIEGATDWSLHDHDVSLVDGAGNLSSASAEDAKATSPSSPATPFSKRDGSASALSSSRASTAPLPIAPPVPTAASLVSAGLGDARAAQVAARAADANRGVKHRLDDLQRRDAADIAEWQHRRDFYSRQRINVLHEMCTAGSRDGVAATKIGGGSGATGLPSSFSSTAVDPWASRQKGAVLGHDVEREEARAASDRAFSHPVDKFHAAVRGSVVAVHGALNPWTVVSASQTATLSGSQRAANVAASGSGSVTSILRPR